MSGTIHLQDGRTVAVVDGLVLGRAADCGIVVDDEKSSRHHARFVVEVGVVEIEDLGSRNGTLLNGAKVERRMVRDGDVITIGRVALTYRAAAAPASAPAVAPSRPASPPPAAKAPAAAADILEFADDEVVAVRAPAPASVGGTAPAPAASPARAAANRTGGILQFSTQSKNRGPLGDDVSQLGGLPKLGVVLLGIALAAGLAWLAMEWVGDR